MHRGCPAWLPHVRTVIGGGIAMDYPAIEDDGLITEMRSRRMRSATPAGIHKGSGAAEQDGET